MTTEDLIEDVIEKGVKAYRKNYRNNEQGIRLTRHEPVEVQGVTFTYWREYAVYKMAQYLQEICPSVSVEVILDGNDSTLKLEIDDAEQRRINSTLYSFLKKVS